MQIAGNLNLPQKERIKSYLLIISIFLVYLIICLFGLQHITTSIFLLFLFEFFNKKRYRFLTGISVVWIIANLLYYFVVNQTTAISGAMLRSGFISNFLTDLGAIKGFGIFSLILLVFGIIKTWQNKYTKETLPLYISLVVFTCCSLFFNETIIYLNTVLSLFVGVGFVYLFEMKWETEIIKNMTIFIIILGLIFSSVSFMNRVVEMPPDKEFLEATDWITHNSEKGAIVLTHQNYGEIIKHHAKRKVILDSNKHSIDKEYYKRQINIVFNSRSLKEIKEILDKHKIDYIFLTEEMKKGLVWNRPEQGFLFVLPNTPDFQLKYSNNKIDIWEYKNGNFS